MNDHVANLALGRIFGMLQRPYRDGDADEYWRCRSIIMDAAEERGISPENHRPNWARDGRKGAAGA